ncbi:uncharacterized protein LOC133909517 isoform X2 [Phragmites australis]|uniref:uncharacterized protein LOC133909517 isoform X2 n=1 Tax=Phragmites australis TaxID=29695 RepID=UPI002D790C99|nr:uncharacterized protein LOC133909517 isoform X2 [Phragmites australis]
MKVKDLDTVDWSSLCEGNPSNKYDSWSSPSIMHSIKERGFCAIIQTRKRLFKRGSSRRGATMEHGGEEEDRGSESKRSLGASSDATVSSAATKLQALRFAEDLSLPSVQVVVMSADMGCSHCRQRVADVVSKMNGLLDYMVDFGKKEVTVRGKVVHTKKKKKHKEKNGLTGWETRSSLSSPCHARTLSWFLGCYGS